MSSYVKYEAHVSLVKAALPNELDKRFTDDDIIRALTSKYGNIVEATELLQKYAYVKQDYTGLYEKMTAKNVK